MKRGLKFIYTAFICFYITSTSFAGEGMWLPQLLKALNEGEMQSMGMKLSAEDIYSVNKGSLKDAIAHFGGFCTSEVISEQGLLLTNHHCGYGQIQSHSSIDNNLLKNGFWAKSFKDELPNTDLFARFILRIEDVSTLALNGVKDSMSPSEKQSQVDKNINAFKAKHPMDDFHELIIRPFYGGNQYFAFFTVVYRDVRLVGTPPESIGKFGSDTDNWVWPRHTGDFALFRIYAGPNNEPANYSEENKPFKPKHALPISLDGVEEGDFTMIFGFPGRTQQYLPSVAVKQVQDVLDPARIGIRDISLEIMDKYMRSDEKTRIQYASKFARIANYWKKWKGERLGLISSNAVEKKARLEADFTKRINNDPTMKSKYSLLLPQFAELYKNLESYAYAKEYYSEVVGRNIEVFTIASIVDRIGKEYENGGDAALNSFLPRVKNYLEGFYKNYNANIDREIFSALLQHYQEKVDANFQPASLRYITEAQIKDIFTQSKFTDQSYVNELLSKGGESAVKTLQSDPVYKLYKDWKVTYDGKIATPYQKVKDEIDVLQKKYMKSLMEAFPEKRFWPDANSTLRVSYGNVNGYQPKDGIYYLPKTHLKGVIEKYVPGDYEFDVSERLIELYENKDFGPYIDETGDVPVCFLGSNHTTGGNSGSPAIDAHGNLIGLNFDRVWEGTMSDINYDVRICRNIMVDVRYVLFIVDKYAGATRLIEEMNLVHPKRK